MIPIKNEVEYALFWQYFISPILHTFFWTRLFENMDRDEMKEKCSYKHINQPIQHYEFSVLYSLSFLYATGDCCSKGQSRRV